MARIVAVFGAPIAMVKNLTSLLELIVSMSFETPSVFSVERISKTQLRYEMALNATNSTPLFQIACASSKFVQS